MVEANERKIGIVEAKLDGIEIFSFEDFLKEQSQSISWDCKVRDTHIVETIESFFRKSGMAESDFFFYTCGVPDYDGWAVEWIDEGIRLYKDRAPIGSVLWCYRGKTGSCWISYE